MLPVPAGEEGARGLSAVEREPETEEPLAHEGETLRGVEGSVLPVYRVPEVSL